MFPHFIHTGRIVVREPHFRWRTFSEDKSRTKCCVFSWNEVHSDKMARFCSTPLRQSNNVLLIKNFCCESFLPIISSSLVSFVNRWEKVLRHPSKIILPLFLPSLDFQIAFMRKMIRFVEFSAFTVVLLAGLWLEKLDMGDREVLSAFGCSRENEKKLIINWRTARPKNESKMKLIKVWCIFRLFENRLNEAKKPSVWMVRINCVFQSWVASIDGADRLCCRRYKIAVNDHPHITFQKRG